MDGWKKELINEPNEATTPSVDYPVPAYQPPVAAKGVCGVAPAGMCGVACTRNTCDDNRTAKGKYRASIKKTAVLQLIGGCLLVCMGIVAVILMAHWSYFATPIWSGLLIFGSTGVIGIHAASSGRRALVRCYLVMSLISSVMGFVLFVVYICALSFENSSPWDHWGDYDWFCQPASYSSIISNCAKSLAARELFDSLIMLNGLFLLTVSIVSASYGCCASCRCCSQCCACCHATPSTVTTTTTANQTVVVPGNQYQQQVGDFPEKGQADQAYPPTHGSNTYIIHAAPAPAPYGHTVALGAPAGGLTPSYTYRMGVGPGALQNGPPVSS